MESVLTNKHNIYLLHDTHILNTNYYEGGIQPSLKMMYMYPHISHCCDIKAQAVTPVGIISKIFQTASGVVSNVLWDKIELQLKSRGGLRVSDFNRSD